MFCFYNSGVFSCSIVWRLPVSDMKVEKNKILVNKEKPDLTINSPVITFSLEPKPQTPLVDTFLIEFKRMKVCAFHL